MSGNRRNPWKSFNSDLEDVLLNPAMAQEDRVTEAKQRFEQQGCVLIVKFHFEEHDSFLKLAKTMYLRQAMEAIIFDQHDTNNSSTAQPQPQQPQQQQPQQHVQCIKYDDERAFLFHPNADVALLAALKVHRLVTLLAQRLDRQHADVHVTCGLDVGPLILLVGDYYGNAVNIASKLGEDHAEPGQILISTDCYNAIVDQDQNNLLDKVHVQDGFVTISSVDIPYKQITAATTLLSDDDVPSHQDLLNPSEESSSASASAQRLMFLSLLSTQQQQQQQQQLPTSIMQTCTMLQSDMSGFTRLTQQYGILHFLTLVANCRQIFRQVLSSTNNSGSIIKYDGDNVICKFDTPHDCITMVRSLQIAIQKYNDNYQDQPDYQIRIKLGVSHGDVCIVHHDIVGKSWEDCCLLGEDTAQVGEILITETVRQELAANKDYQYERRTIEELQHYNLSFAAATADLGLHVDTPPIKKMSFKRSVYRILSSLRKGKQPQQQES